MRPLRLCDEPSLRTCTGRDARESAGRQQRACRAFDATRCACACRAGCSDSAARDFNTGSGTARRLETVPAFTSARPRRVSPRRLA